MVELHQVGLGRADVQPVVRAVGEQVVTRTGYRLAELGDTEGLSAYVAAGATDLRVGLAAPTPADEAATRDGLAQLASARGWL